MNKEVGLGNRLVCCLPPKREHINRIRRREYMNKEVGLGNLGMLHMKEKTLTRGAERTH